MVICLGQGADLHMAQLMPLPLTVFCFSKIQILVLVLAHLGNPGQSSEGHKTAGWVCAYGFRLDISVQVECNHNDVI